MDIQISELQSTDNHKDFCALLDQLTTTNPNAITEEMFLQRLELINKNPFHKIFVAKDKNKIIGTVAVFIEPKFIHHLSLVAYIEDVVVDNIYRNFGVGKMLVQKALEFANKYNCYEVMLNCSDQYLKFFYEKFGFIKKGNKMAKYLS